MSPEYRAFIIQGDDGQEYGPVDLGELREWVQENRAGLGTTVRLDEPGALWQPWQYYPELVALLAEVGATTPIPGQPALVIASLGKRVIAFVVDIILGRILASPIIYIILLLHVPNWQEQVVRAILQSQSTLSQPLLFYMVICGLISDTFVMFYMAGFHAAHGRTPGKSIMRLKVVDQTGQKPTFVKSFLRALVLIVSLNCYGIPLAYAFFNPQRRTFHDFVAGTYVVEA